MTNDTQEEKAKKAARMRAYRAANKKKMSLYRKRYYKKHKAKIAEQTKIRYAKNLDKMRERARNYYYKNKAIMNEKSNRYRKAHIAEINEWSRKNYYKRLGKPIKEKSFSFYRDFVKAINKTTDKNHRLAVYRIILSLPLTDLQRKVVKLTRDGVKQKDIAKQIGIGQSGICKVWNGSQMAFTKIFYGGIYSKFVKVVSKDKEIQRLLNKLNLKWRDSDGKRNKKRQIPMDAGRDSLFRHRMG